MVNESKPSVSFKVRPSLYPCSSALTPSQTEFAVDMTCQSCVSAVRAALQPIPGIESYDIDLDRKQVVVTGRAAPSAVCRALKDTGRQVLVRGSGTASGEYTGPLPSGQRVKGMFCRDTRRRGRRDPRDAASGNHNSLGDALAAARISTSARHRAHGAGIDVPVTHAHGSHRQVPGLPCHILKTTSHDTDVRRLRRNDGRRDLPTTIDRPAAHPVDDTHARPINGLRRRIHRAASRPMATCRTRNGC